MMSASQIAGMSREEKLQTMEALWADLSKDAAGIESPAWHGEALKEAEARVSAGDEKITDWASAKQELRQRFQ